MQTKRRRWVHQINTGKPLSKVSGVDTTCAICRGLFCEPCLDCQAEESIDKSVGLLVLKTKELWYTLLLMAKRPPFISLSIDLIRRIYDFSLPEQQHRLWICPIVQIHCGHTYHRHCISKWIAKRPCCPLDNQPLNGQLLADFSADITDITVSPYTHWPCYKCTKQRVHLLANPRCKHVIIAHKVSCTDGLKKLTRQCGPSRL